MRCYLRHLTFECKPTGEAFRLPHWEWESPSRAEMNDLDPSTPTPFTNWRIQTSSSSLSLWLLSSGARQENYTGGAGLIIIMNRRMSTYMYSQAGTAHKGVPRNFTQRTAAGSLGNTNSNFIAAGCISIVSGQDINSFPERVSIYHMQTKKCKPN